MTKLPQIRSAIRASVNRARCNNIGVDIVPGNAGPVLTGESGGFFTKGGVPISHPSAYAKRGWSNMMYQCSTECITVGAAWIADHILSSKSDMPLAIAFRAVSESM